MLHSDSPATVAVCALSRREDALGEARRAQEHFANSDDFDNVYTNGNDHKRNRTDERRLLLARN